MILMLIFIMLVKQYNRQDKTNMKSCFI